MHRQKIIGLTQLTIKGDEFVYNWVTQSQAAKLSKNMYNNSNFTSDLVNSYAWDTAILFLQQCDDREYKSISYSMQNSINTVFANKGTNNLETQDIICNIYDMASNCGEWTTETCTGSWGPCVGRGCNYTSNKFFTSTRGNSGISDLNETSSFRPIIYL